MSTPRLCLNSSTLSNQSLGIVAEVEIAAEAGFSRVELWLPSIHAYVDAGGSLDDFRRRVDDLGIVVENGIGFAAWIVDDDDLRRAGLETARRDMEALATIGCRRIAAPPVGAVEGPVVATERIVERFDALATLGASFDVTPQLELWGFAGTLHHLDQVLDVVAQRSEPTGVLLDVFHLVRGGSGIDLTDVPSGARLEIFHVNDVPADIEADSLTDADRVLPGDGVAPLGELIRQLSARDDEVVLSLELFDRRHWDHDPRRTAAVACERLESLVGAV